jgi:hypothetical protein
MPPMMPLEIAGTNVTLMLPSDLLGNKTKARCVRARIVSIKNGPLDGLSVAVVAYKPSPLDVSRILAGEPIYISFLAGVAPHFLSTTLEEALNPS